MKSTRPSVLAKACQDSSNVPNWLIASFSGRLAVWFAYHGRTFPWRARSASPFHLLLAELLLQRTRATIVVAEWPRITLRLTNWSDIVACDPEELEDLLSPLGLAHRRSAAIKELARAILSCRGELPSTRAALEQLPGIGQYIAGAFLTAVCGEAEPLLDVNMARLLERFFGPRHRSDIRDDPYLQGLSRRVLRQGASSPLNLNWAMLDLASAICKKGIPHCSACPLTAGCLWFSRTTEYSV